MTSSMAKIRARSCRCADRMTDKTIRSRLDRLTILPKLPVG